MNIQMKYFTTIVLVSAALGGILTRAYIPRETTKVQTVEKEVTKTQDVVQNKDVIVTKELIHKDGTKEIETTVTKNTTKTQDQTVVDAKKTSVTDVKTGSQKQWFVSIGAALDGSDGFRDLANPIYLVNVNRRILGPFYVGATGTSKSQFGLALGVEF